MNREGERGGAASWNVKLFVYSGAYTLHIYIYIYISTPPLKRTMAVERQHMSYYHAVHVDKVPLTMHFV